MSAYKGPRAKITIRLAEATHNELTAYAVETGISSADLMVRIIEQHLTARRRLGKKGTQAAE